jgi:2-oxo-4-hydroxy-4-carboxy--5-ureidoimidazoline (OHCU) decarboxylase
MIYFSIPAGYARVQGAKVEFASTPEVAKRYRKAYAKPYVIRGKPAVVDGVVIEGTMRLAKSGDEQARAAVEALGGVVLPDT